MDYKTVFTNSFSKRTFYPKAFLAGKFTVLLLGLLLAGLANSQAFKKDVITRDQLMPSIGGYSPVSYFTKGIAEQGQVEFAVMYDGSTYLLASAEQVSLFNDNPTKYHPKYSICPYSLTLGMKLPLDPTNFKIVGDSLLMFHLSDDVDGLQEWNESSKTDAELIELADYNYTLLKF
jgi:YHS domain-containing protein